MLSEFDQIIPSYFLLREPALILATRDVDTMCQTSEDHLL